MCGVHIKIGRLRKGMVIGMKIVVLAGGTSTERDVSLSSGGMIYRALKKKGHKAILLDVYLGYEGETEGIFEGDTDWASQIGAIVEENPDLETVKALLRSQCAGSLPECRCGFYGASWSQRGGRQDSGMF